MDTEAKTTRGAGRWSAPVTLAATGQRRQEADWRGRRRMSAKRKQSLVLRLLRGEDLELVSRELGVTAGEPSSLVPTGLRRQELCAGAARAPDDPAHCPEDQRPPLGDQ